MEANKDLLNALKEVLAALAMEACNKRVSCQDGVVRSCQCSQCVLKRGYALLDEFSSKCCADCEHMRYESACHDQPYPEFWCGKGHWDSGDCDAIKEPVDCSDWGQKND